MNICTAVKYCMGVFALCVDQFKWRTSIIRITRPCDLYPLAPHYCIVKLGFTGVYIFSFLLKNKDCEYSNEAVLTCSDNICFERK